MKKFSKFLPFLLVCIGCIFAILPLFHPGFFPMHDDEQVQRLYELHKDITALEFPPRIAQDLGFGYGYPLFNFYPSFAYYIAELFKLGGFSYILSTKLMIAAGFFAAAIFMYLFAKEYIGKIGGVVAAISYTYAPYHAVDVYVRGALAEFWSFVFIAAVFWAYTKLQKTGKFAYVFIAAFCNAGLLLSHNAIAFMISGFIGIFLFYLFINCKNKKTFFLQTIFSIALAFLLTAYYFLPALLEKHFTLVELLTTEFANYNLHFVCFEQFWNSPWGYGGSLLGCNDGLSFQVGKIHIIGSIVSFFLFLYFLKTKKKKHLASFIFLFVVFFVLSLFLQLRVSHNIWDSIQFFSYIQFPWRYLTFTAFCSSVLLGSLAKLFESKRIQYGFVGILILLLLVINKDFFQPKTYFTHVTDSDYVSKNVIEWDTSIKSFEYVPKGVVTKKSSMGNTVVAIKKDEIAKNSYTILSGDLKISVLQDLPERKTFAVSSETGGKLQISTYSFPGWKVFIDDNEVTYSDNNKLKLVTVNIPSGAHTINAKFTNTLVRSVGNILTLTSILLFCFYLFMILVKPILVKKLLANLSLEQNQLQYK